MEYTNKEIILHPGELYFGAAPKRIRTVLGSCVAISVWHPQLRVGGLCHYLIATTGKPKEYLLDTKYAAVAGDQLIRHMTNHGRLDAYQVSIWGGGDMNRLPLTETVGFQNIAFARQWVEAHNLQLRHEDVGSDICRTLIFDLADGVCYLKKYRVDDNGHRYEH